MNILSIEHRNVVLSDNQRSATFWVVKIDGELVTENAKPFDATKESLILNECEDCFYCGLNEITVRRIGDNAVVWYVSLDDAYESRIPRNRIIAFDRDHYESVVGGKSSSLPEFTTEDARHWLPQLRLPDWRLALYTIPETPNHCFGRSILRLFAESLSSSQVMVKSLDDTELVQELRIGIDAPGFPETAVRMLSVNGEIWFKLIENPWVPVWFSHPEITKRLPELISSGLS